jgi:hypothetical protein
MYACSVLVALVALRQHSKAQQNDEQTDYLKNHVPCIIALTEYNQDTSKFARECHNLLQRERHAM